MEGDLAEKNTNFFIVSAAPPVSSSVLIQGDCFLCCLSYLNILLQELPGHWFIFRRTQKSPKPLPGPLQLAN